MEQTSVQKLARVLRVLVIIIFVCNVITLYFVPGLALFRGEIGRLQELTPYQHFWEVPLRVVILCSYCWFPTMWAFAEARVSLALAVFLLVCGICTANILWQAKQVLDTILKGEPFTLNNAANMKRAAVCCFVISGAALARLIWGLVYYASIRPLLTYNALFVPVFLVGGLLFLVMSALFRQAAELKAENDLTI